MCYTNIKSIKETDQKYFYKIVDVDEHEKNKYKYISYYTLTPLPIEKWLKSKNIKREDSFGSGHSYQSCFEGFGVFETITDTEKDFNDLLG